MSYYLDLLRQHGVQGRTIREILDEVLQEPTDDKLRVVGALAASEVTRRTNDPEILTALSDFLAILQVEREWLHRQQG